MSEPDQPASTAGTITACADGTFTLTTPDGRVAPHEVDPRQREELRALLALRDTLAALRATLSDADRGGAHEDAPAAAALRLRLNQLYDDYVGRYGPINRVTTRRRGWIVEQRIWPRLGGFRADRHAADVFALERYHESENFAIKAAIFDGPVGEGGEDPPTAALGSGP